MTKIADGGDVDVEIDARMGKVDALAEPDQGRRIDLVTSSSQLSCVPRSEERDIPR
jgi:hypothetical protein